MNPPASLNPTLWRTCRILANRARLETLRLLSQEQELSVSEVAARLSLSMPLTSQNLRALESRGLLTVKRQHRYVRYRLAGGTTTAGAAALMPALRKVLRRERSPVEAVFSLATAFTHPRRLEMYRALAQGPLTLEQLQSATRIPPPALLRHLKKLETRGFVTCHADHWAAVERTDELGQMLSRLAKT